MTLNNYKQKKPLTLRTDTKNVLETKINDLQRRFFNLQITQKHFFGYSMKSSLFSFP